MSIEAGKDLLQYRLIEKIGEGGMGAVWKAADTTLNREVAIKILPDLFAQDADRRGRFEREARLLASLNHPNIAAIYGLHEAQGVHFLAMELISGQNLAERISKGAVPVDDALPIARQVAEALEAAHENGIVHRDLKPANIQLTEEGVIKVLDFGLAKALAPEPSDTGASPTMSPTLTSAGTVAGMVLGTAAYMSPEQAKGKPVDRRADVWAFGVVLYEMLTGGQLFTGETISETLAAVLLRDVDFEGLPGNTPLPVRALLERCLHKDPRQRLRDIGEARIALQSPDASSLTSVAAAAAPAEAPRRSFAPWVVAGVMAVGALLGVWAPWRSAPPAPDPMFLRVELSPDANLFAGYGAAALLSPDGDRLVYVSGGGDRMLYMRSLGESEAKVVPGSEEGYHPFFSPDGQWLGFVTRERLKKVSTFGGTPIALADVSLSRGATWGTDGTIVYAPSPNSGLMRIPDRGGEPEPLTELNKEEDEFTHRWPQYLPGNGALLFTVHTSGASFDDARIEVLDVETKQRRTLQHGGSYARYVPTGHIVFVRDGTLYAMGFDVDARETTGPPFPILEDVTQNPIHGSAQFDFSSTGILVYSTGSSVGRMASLVGADRDGKSSPLSGDVAELYHPR
jgi:serine/threonine-protein kinase